VKRTVFWSWQSDQPARETRNFIKTALQGALAKLQAEFQEAERPEIDHDTKNVPGSPDIVAAILEKIEAAAVFVADVTPIAISASGKHVANPNVLIELGYAKRALSLGRVIQVWNTALTDATPENLPFDMRQRRKPIEYALEVGAPTEELRRARAKLQQELESALRAILAVLPAEPAPAMPWKEVEVDREFLWKGGDLPVTFDEDTVDLGFEGPPAGYARLIPQSWVMVANAYDRLRRSNRQLSPLGRVGGLNWGPTSNGFLATRWSDRIQQDGMTPTATRWFRDTGEIWGIDSSFFGESNGETVFASVYAGQRWVSWLNWHYDVCRLLGGTGPIHARIGVSGLNDTRWPRGPLGAGRGPRALEPEAAIEFILDGAPDVVAGQVSAEVEKMINAVAAAYGVL
jgi:hypothetical protein